MNAIARNFAIVSRRVYDTLRLASDTANSQESAGVSAIDFSVF